MAPKIDWMTRKHMPEVLDIERASFPYPWSRKDYEKCLRAKNCVGKVLTLDDRVVGLLIYALADRRLEIINIATHPRFRKQGVGRALLEHLQDKIKSEASGQYRERRRRTRIDVDVRETNLDALNFFKACQFRGVSIKYDNYADVTEDAIHMRYTHAPLALVNRISKFLATGGQDVQHN